jgi:hypothetical protein
MSWLSDLLPCSEAEVKSYQEFRQQAFARRPVFWRMYRLLPGVLLGMYCAAIPVLLVLRFAGVIAWSPFLIIIGTGITGAVGGPVLWLWADLVPLRMSWRKALRRGAVTLLEVPPPDESEGPHPLHGQRTPPGPGSPGQQAASAAPGQHSPDSVTASD